MSTSNRSTAAHAVASLGDYLASNPVQGRSGRLAEQVHGALVHAIVSGRFPARSRLPAEVELARLFEVSRPVVREALDHLRDEGLIESRRGSGSFVRNDGSPMPSLPLARSDEEIQHFLHGLELRLAIEPDCAGWAASRRSSDDLRRMEAMIIGFEAAAESDRPGHDQDFGFHLAIAEATGNPRLAAVLRPLDYDLSHAVTLWRHLAAQKRATIQQALAEHRALFAAIRARRPNQARDCMRTHLENARARFLTLTRGP